MFKEACNSNLNRTRNHWLLSSVCNLLLFPALVCILAALNSVYKDRILTISFLYLYLIWAAIPLLIMGYASYIKRGCLWIYFFLFFNPTFPFGLLSFMTGDTQWKFLFGTLFLGINIWWYRSSFNLVKSNRSFNKNDLFQKHKLGHSLSYYECIEVLRSAENEAELNMLYSEFASLHTDRNKDLSTEYRLTKLKF